MTMEQWFYHFFLEDLQCVDVDVNLTQLFHSNPGYDITQWKDVLLRLGQTKTFFTTNTVSPFCSKSHRTDNHILKILITSRKHPII